MNNKIHPLSNAQNRLWYLHCTDVHSSNYNITFSITFSGHINFLALQRAYQYVFSKHEILRTSMHEKDGVAFQVVDDKVTSYIHDMGSVSQQQFLEQARVKAATSIDLSADPLLSCCYYKIEQHTHKLLFVIHHIIFDEWSVNLLINDLAEAYNAFDAGKAPTNDNQICQYTVFALHEDIYLKSPQAQTKLAHWQRYLANCPLQTIFLPSKANYGAAALAGATHYHKISKSLLEKIHHFSRGNMVTPFVLMLTTWFIQLSRYTGCHDVITGVPFANRNDEKFEKTIGLCMNSLPLRCMIKKNDTLATIMMRVYEDMLDCYENQEIPFNVILDSLNCKRVPGQNPLFQTMFFLDTPTDLDDIFNGLSYHYDFIDNHTAKLDFMLSANLTDENAYLRCEYKTEIYSQELVDNICSVYLDLLENFITTPDVNIHDVALLSPNATENLYKLKPTSQLIADVYHLILQHKGDQIAAICQDVAISYNQLLTSSAQVAAGLLNEGIQHGDIVAVMLPPSIDLLSVLLACLQLGVTYLPIDNKCPEIRKNNIIDHAVPKILVTYAPITHSQQVTTITVDKLVSNNSQLVFADCDAIISKPHHAYIIYTSGSTGTPKGVCVSRQALNASLAATSNLLSVSDADSFLALTNIMFDVSFHDYLLPLTHGATVIIADEYQRQDPSQITQLIHQYAISMMQATPSMGRFLLANDFKVTHPMTWLLAGEALPLSLVKQLGNKVTLFNLYGPTEATIYATGCRVDHDDASISIGKALQHYQAICVDDNGNAQPSGAVGELVLGGAGLAEGYLHQDCLTQQKFKNLAFPQLKPQRFYFTGDVVSTRIDGSFEYLGRKDNQVKIRGNRIELEEVEVCLQKSPNIEQVVVLAREDLTTHSILVAYYTSTEQDDLSAQLANHISQYLPDYMIPSYFIKVTSFALNHAGKIDRDKLLAPKAASQSFVPATELSETESVLLQIWQEILGTANIAITDNFYQIGGDSILSIQLIAAMRMAGYDISVTQFMHHPTIKTMAAVTKRLSADVVTDVQMTANHDQHFSLSPLQQGLYFHKLMHPNSPAYVLVNLFQVADVVDQILLQQAWENIFTRFEVLRTAITQQPQGNTRQCIHRDCQLPWQNINIAHINEDAIGEYLDGLMINIQHQGFNLQSPPYMRLVYVNTADKKQYLIWAYHHIILDGWSGPIILSALEESISRLLSDRTLCSQNHNGYSKYLLWLERHDWQQAKMFWQQYLNNDSYPGSLTTVKPQHRDKSYDSYFAKLTVLQTSQVVDFAKTMRVSLATIIQSAYLIALSRYIQSDRLTIGVVFSGRTAGPEDITNTAGLFINTLPFRINLNDSQTIVGIVQNVQQQLHELQNYEYCSLAQVREFTEIDNAANLFDCIFVFENYPQTNEHSNKLTHIKSLDRNEFPLSFAVEPGEQLSFYISYQKQCYLADTIADVYASIERILLSMPAYAEQHWRDCPYLGLTHEQKIINNYESISVIGDLITSWQQQVFENPNAIALSDGKASMTYTALDKLSSQLASYCVSKTTTTPKVIAIQLGQSISHVVAILATLKVGGAYLALSDRDPVARNKHMLLDAKADVLITNDLYHPLYAAISVPIINMDSYQDIIAQQPLYDCPVINNQAVAYIVYTSGSTGKPKGIAVTHASVYNLVSNFNNLMPQNQNIVNSSLWTQTTFDVSAYEIWSAICFGKTLHIIDERIRHTPIQVFEYYVTQQIHSAYIPPAYLPYFVKWLEGSESQCALKFLLLGVEPIKCELVQEIFHYLPKLTIVNAYGPSEATICATYMKITKETKFPYTKTLPIGRAVNNCYLRVLDKHQQLTPPGVIGELYIGGACLSTGYIGEHENNQQSFIQDPFASVPAQLYKTGDLVRYCADGELEFIGRSNQQIKIRGYRVELGEIETTLLAIKEILQVRVIIAHNSADHLIIIAYVVCPADLFDETSLKQQLASTLPDHMLPLHIVNLDEMPLTAHGKVDDSVLPLPKEKNTPIQSADKTEDEKILLNIFSDVLCEEITDTQADFFELGGDSILAIQVLLQMQQQGFALEMQDLFNYPNVKQLLQYITKNHSAPQTPSTETTTDPYDLSPIQSWFFEKNFTLVNHFNQSFNFSVSQRLEPQLVEDTWYYLIEHHEILRCRFILFDGKYKQQLHKQSVNFFNYHPNLADDAAMCKIENDCQRALDISEGQLLKVALLETTSGEQTLFVVIHHLAVDSVSWRILIEDFCQTYTQLSLNQVPTLCRRGSYAAWITAMTRFASSSAINLHQQYWHKFAKHYQQSVLPVDSDSSVNLVRDMQVCKIQVNEQATKYLLNGKFSKNNITMNALLISALANTLQTWSGLEVINIDLEGHGREIIDDQTDISQVVGWFTSIFPISLDLSCCQSVQQCQQYLNAVPSKGIGYGILRYFNQDETLGQINPEVCFNYLGQWHNHTEQKKLIGFTHKRQSDDHAADNQLKYKIDLLCYIANSQLNIEWRYSDKQYHSVTITNFAKNFENYLLSITHESASFQYLLSTLQQGMLYTGLTKQEHHYVVQAVFKSEKYMDEEKLRSAWQHAVSHFEVLQTQFAWQQLDNLYQTVNKDAKMPWQSLNWCGLSATSQDEALAALLAKDKQQPFDRAQAPLMRCYFIKLNHEQSYLIWTHDHIILDGWSASLLLNYVEDHYDKPSTADCASPLSYFDYINYLQKLDKTAAIEFWQEYLHGIAQNISISPLKNPENLNHEVIEYFFNEQDNQLLQRMSKHYHVTLNTVLQLAWSLCLSQYLQRRDFVVGIVVSGRQQALAGIDQCLGLFINTLPLRIKLEPNQTIKNLLTTISKDVVSIQRYGYLSLPEIRRLLPSSFSNELFDNIIAFANYPHRKHKPLTQYHYKMQQLDEKTEYPLCIAALMHKTFGLRFTYKMSHFSNSQASDLMMRLTTTIKKLIENYVKNYEYS